MASNAELELMDLERAVSNQRAYIHELETGPVADPYELEAAREDLKVLEARQTIAHGDWSLEAFADSQESYDYR